MKVLKLKGFLDLRNTKYVCAYLLLSLIIGCSETSISVPQLTTKSLAYQLEAGPIPVIIDARSPSEFQQGRIPGAIQINHEASDIPQRLARYKNHEIVVYCQQGYRANTVIEKLHIAGFTNLKHLKGDYKEWFEEGRPTERD